MRQESVTVTSFSHDLSSAASAMLAAVARQMWQLQRKSFDRFAAPSVVHTSLSQHLKSGFRHIPYVTYIRTYYDTAYSQTRLSRSPTQVGQFSEELLKKLCCEK